MRRKSWSVKMHLTPHMYKIMSLWRHMLRKSLLVKCMLSPHMYKTITLKANANDIITVKCKENHHLKMHLAPNMYKIVTLKANAKKIMSLENAVWCQICTKMLLWRQMFRKSSLENAFGTKYVQNCYFKGKCLGYCHFLIHVAPNMYKTITVNSNAKKIVTLKCIWHHICAKLLLCRQMVRKSLFDKCIWHHICIKLLLWRHMLRKSCHLTNAFDTKYVQNCYFEGKC